MPKDCDGKEITLGCQVRHADELGFHEFKGIGKVVHLTPAGRVMVSGGTGKDGIPLYLPHNLQVVSGPPASEEAAP